MNLAQSYNMLYKMRCWYMYMH